MNGMKRQLYGAAIVIIVAGFLPELARAQVAPSITMRPWQVEVSAGLGRTSAMPLQGNTHTPISGSGVFVSPSGFNTRAPSSWFYGDGPFVMSNITPLDAIIKAPGILSTSSSKVGVRVSRWLSPRFAGEVSLTYGTASLAFGEPTQKAVEASRGSFVNAFTNLFNATPSVYLSPKVTAVTEVSRPPGELTVIGNAILALNTGRTSPYLEAGLGPRLRVGSPVQISLTGRYQFRTPGGAPIDETNHLILQYVTPARSIAWQFGGGLQHHFNERAGMRIDVHASAVAADGRLVLTNTSTTTPGVPAGSVEQDPAAGNLRIVFSNTPAIRASLSGTQQVGLSTFEATGTRWQVNMSVGWFWSF